MARAEATVHVGLKLDEQSAAAMSQLGWLSPKDARRQADVVKWAKIWHEAHEGLHHGDWSAQSLALAVAILNGDEAAAAAPAPLIGAEEPVSPQPEGNDSALLAERFHEVYERLAPEYGYETRKSSAKPWAEVPERNRALMIAVCEEILTWLAAPVATGEETP